MMERIMRNMLVMERSGMMGGRESLPWLHVDPDSGGEGCYSEGVTSRKVKESNNALVDLMGMRFHLYGSRAVCSWDGVDVDDVLVHGTSSVMSWISLSASLSLGSSTHPRSIGFGPKKLTNHFVSSLPRSSIRNRRFLIASRVFRSDFLFIGGSVYIFGCGWCRRVVRTSDRCGSCCIGANPPCDPVCRS